MTPCRSDNGPTQHYKVDVCFKKLQSILQCPLLTVVIDMFQTLKITIFLIFLPGQVFVGEPVTTSHPWFAKIARG